jgi:hypothetical protein
MTVKELMAELAKYPEDMEVLKKYDDSEHASYGYEEIYETYISNHEVILE